MCRFASITANDSSGGRGFATAAAGAKNDSDPEARAGPVAGKGSTGGASDRRTDTAGTTPSILTRFSEIRRSDQNGVEPGPKAESRRPSCYDSAEPFLSRPFGQWC